MANFGLFRLGQEGCYSLYVLIVLLLAYLLNQLDRYLVAITNPSMSRDVGYGNLGCLQNLTFPASAFEDVTCGNATSSSECNDIENKSGTKVCDWDHTGKGVQYDLLAGPVFIVVFTFSGILVGLLSNLYNRKVLLGSCVILWSVTTILTGLVKQYWQLALLRFALGIFEAGCTPFAASIIGDYFSQNVRATAMGVYNWGIYVGYSMSFAVGNFITNANILGQGWRWSYYLSGIPGVFLGALILLTIKEPDRQGKVEGINDEEHEGLIASEDGTSRNQSSGCAKLINTLKKTFSLSLLVLVLAGSIRNASGYVFGYYAQTYYESLGRTKEEIGAYMSWIPLVGGSMSVVFGGLIADYVVKKYGAVARVFVIVISLFLAAPFAAGALYFKPPGAYISLIPAYLIGEMWISITMTIVIELVPVDMRTSCIAIYLFVITNIGGNAALLVTPIKNAFLGQGLSSHDSLQGALYILYPGSYVLGGLVYLISAIILKVQKNKDALRVRSAQAKGLGSNEDLTHD